MHRRRDTDYHRSESVKQIWLGERMHLIDSARKIYRKTVL